MFDIGVCCNGGQYYHVERWLGLSGEGDYKDEEASQRVAGASVQTRRVQDYQHVSIFFFFKNFSIEFVHDILLCNVFVFVCYTVITLIPSAQSGAKNVYAKAPSRLLSTAL